MCGDETQKPFPLLVWNLKSKKLLYDLRIPHHDFITSLSAITYEGITLKTKIEIKKCNNAF